MLEIRYKRFEPFNWGAVFNNPGALGTGLLPQDYAQGQIKYLDLDLAAKSAKFATDINVPLKPFQGTLGVAPPDGYFPPLSPGVTSSVPPGPHAGNLDLSELSEGSALFIPVWKPGGLIFTGDSHAVQGDGEISLTALETRMKDMRIQVVLHKQKNFAWPVAETDTHWIIVGLDKDLNVAMALGRAQRDQIPCGTRQDHRARCVRLVQHRRELPGHAGRGYRSRRACDDSQEPVHGCAPAGDRDRLMGRRAVKTHASSPANETGHNNDKLGYVDWLRYV